MQARQRLDSATNDWEPSLATFHYLNNIYPDLPDVLYQVTRAFIRAFFWLPLVV